MNRFMNPAATRIASAALALSVLGACGLLKKSDDDVDTTDLLAVAVGPVGDALNQRSNSNKRLKTNDDVHLNPQADCTSVAFQCTTPGVYTRDFGTSGCTRNSITVYGKVILTLSDGTCSDLSSDNSMTRRFEDFYVALASGTKVLTYTELGTVAGKELTDGDLIDWSGTDRSGGSQISQVAHTYNVDIFGVHHRALKSDGTWGSWTTTYTKDTIVAEDNDGVNYTINQGSVVVAHNIAKVNATVTFSGVTYPLNHSSCYPNAGSLSMVLTNSEGATLRTVDVSFTGSGTATIDGNSVELPTCGGATE